MSTSLAGSQQAPKVTVELDVDPPNFRVGSGEPPTLLIVAKSHAPKPITVFTWPTILNPKLALRRKNFYCLDLTDGRKPLVLETSKVCRRGFQHNKGCGDDQYHVTLPPGEPVVFEARFTPAYRATTTPCQEHQCHRSTMTPGHKYLFGVADGETIDWWREGTRDEVLEEGEDDDSDEPPPIRIENVRPVVLVAEE